MSREYFFTKVMLIDDGEIDLLVNRRLIELTSFASSVIITSSAEEALEFFKNECRNSEEVPDWIFLDMNLPGISGYEFVESFSSLPNFIKNKCRIVILSAFQKKELLEKVLTSPFVHSQLEKPLTQQSLKALASSVRTTTDASS